MLHSYESIITDISRVEVFLLIFYYVKGFKYIARDDNDRLYVYKGNVKKGKLNWIPEENDFVCSLPVIDEFLFLSIQWKDEKPFSIVEFINQAQDILVKC